MRHSRVLALTAVAASLLAFSVVPAQAEWFADLYGGASFTQKGDVDVTISGIGTILSGTAEDQKYKTSFLVGGRAGYWWSSETGIGVGRFFGVNLDINYFQPDPDDVNFSDPTLGTLTTKNDLDVVSIGLNLMLRWQFLANEQVPQGRLQPYLFAGPTLFISTLNVKATATAPGLGTGTFSDSDTDTSIGVTAGAGLTWMFTQNIGAFGEFRYTYNKPEFNFNPTIFQGASPIGVKVEPTLNTIHLLAGLTVRF
jgi:opacity protein-like surface antigen